MKKNILKVILGLIFLIAFNALFFLLGGTQRTTTEWISYGFIHFSYLCILATPLFCKQKKGRTVLNYSLYLRAFIYFLIALTAGVSCIIWNPEEILWPSVIQGAIATVFLIMQIMSVIANEVTDKSLEQQENEKQFIQDLAFRTREAMLNATDSEARQKLRELYNLLKSASIASCPEAGNIELEMENDIKLLCSGTDLTPDQMDKIIRSVKDNLRKRNAIITKARF